MNAKELRIDNWIEGFLIPRRIEQCTIMDIEQAEHCDPVPLDETWLRKFGFKIDNKNNINSKYNEWVKGNFGVCIDKKTGNIIYYLGDLKYKYVHTLQNLYFALTNKELKIK